MQSPTSPATWPGPSRRKTLILPLDPKIWAPPPRRRVSVDGVWFEPKSELHVTLINRDLLRRLLDVKLPQRRLRLGAIRRAFEDCDWRLSRSGQLVLMRKREHDRGGSAASIIELVELPGLTDFYRQLRVLMDADVPAPPPHVTLYTHGRPEGIGVADERALRAMRVRTLSMGELGLPPIMRST